jgi:hypothetical protein
VPRDFIGGKGAQKAPDLIEIKNLDTNCDHCFAPAEKVYYNVNKKTLLVVCANNHESNIQGNWEQLLGLEK